MPYLSLRKSLYINLVSINAALTTDDKVLTNGEIKSINQIEKSCRAYYKQLAISTLLRF